MALSQVFLQHAGGARKKFARLVNLESLLAKMVEGARDAWPGFDLPAEEFVGYAAERLAAAQDPVKAFDGLHAQDLYLALGCRNANAAALRLFEENFLTEATAQVSRREQDRPFIQELAQRLRVLLFVQRDGSPPKIATYSGQGPLGGWMRTVTSRLAVDLRRQEKRQHPGGGPDMDIRSPGLDPELDYLRTVYRADLQEVFRGTLSSLSIQEANILRLHFLEGATVAALAGLYHISARTMARRIAETRQSVIDETRRRLVGRLNLPQSQINTLMAHVQSQVQSIVCEVLKGGDR